MAKYMTTVLQLRLFYANEYGMKEVYLIDINYSESRAYWLICEKKIAYLVCDSWQSVYLW